MRYALLIYTDESAWDSQTPEQMRQVMQAYGEFSEATRAAGAFVGGDGLQGVSTSTTVRVRDGERLLTDGPFAETKEQLAGFYLLECSDLDDALGWAARLPGAQVGSVEVRPVMDYEAVA